MTYSRPDDLLNITTDDGKYTLIQRAGGPMEALRYGEPWAAGVDGSPPHTYVSKRLLTFAQDLHNARRVISKASDLLGMTPAELTALVPPE